MMLGRFWRELRLWLLRQVHNTTIRIAQWSESQLSHSSPVASVSEIGEERQPGQAPKHWLDKVQAASQVPDHWLNHIQERLGHIPEMQDMSALASSSPENTNSDVAHAAQLSRSAETSYQSPDSQSGKRENQYNSLKKSHIPEHLRWRIAPVRKAPQEPIVQSVANHPKSDDVRYQSPDGESSESVASYQDDYPAAQEAKVSPASETDYAQTKQSGQSETNYQTLPEKEASSDLAFARKQDSTTGETSYQKPVNAPSEPDSFESVSPAKTKTVPQTNYQSAKQSAENNNSYQALSQGHQDNEADYAAKTEQPRDNIPSYQMLETSRQVETKYPARKQPNNSQAEYQTPETSRPVETNYPARKQSNNSQAEYQTPETSRPVETNYPARHSGRDAAPQYQSAQQSRENTVSYSEAAGQQSVSESDYANFVPVKKTTSVYQSDESITDARQALAGAADDYWIPLAMESRRTESSSPVQKTGRIDAEQRGEM